MNWRDLRKNAAIVTSAKWGIFTALTAVLWAAYFTWRPPAPMLGLQYVDHLDPASKEVSLTFDDAPHPLTTPLLLAALHRANVKATFFVVGESLRYYPELGARIAREGHTLANHSYGHHNLTRTPIEEYGREVQGCFDAIRAVEPGSYYPWRETRLFRPPGGGMDRAVMKHLYDNGVVLGWWSHNVGDWEPMSKHAIVVRVDKGLKPGDIILMHDAGTSTAQAIPQIVREARSRGLRFVPMPDKPENNARLIASTR